MLVGRKLFFAEDGVAKMFKSGSRLSYECDRKTWKESGSLSTLVCFLFIDIYRIIRNGAQAHGVSHRYRRTLFTTSSQRIC